jgi:nucleotide-binding universal stress UspA family protein
MRSILVEAGRDAGMTARLDTALAIARASEGHVTLLVDTPISQFVAVDPYGGSMLARDALETALKQDDALAAACTEQLARDDVPFDVVQSERDPTEALASAARLADLVVVARETGRAGDLAVEARCPVLALAAGQSLASPPAIAAVAWDGGDQAAHALRSAVPLLRTCGAVHVIAVQTDVPGAFPSTEALRYLSRHGIKAELHEVLRGDSIEQTLADEVRRLGAGLLVMGAYGHSRTREFLFGGVTRYFLNDPATPPLLLAH